MTTSGNHRYLSLGRLAHDLAGLVGTLLPVIVQVVTGHIGWTAALSLSGGSIVTYLLTELGYRPAPAVTHAVTADVAHSPKGANLSGGQDGG